MSSESTDSVLEVPTAVALALASQPLPEPQKIIEQVTADDDAEPDPEELAVESAGRVFSDPLEMDQLPQEATSEVPVQGVIAQDADADTGTTQGEAAKPNPGRGASLWKKLKDHLPSQTSKDVGFSAVVDAVRDRLLFDFEKIHHDVDYRQQANPQMYLPEVLKLRAALRHEPHVMDAMLMFWRTFRKAVIPNNSIEAGSNSARGRTQNQAKAKRVNKQKSRIESSSPASRMTKRRGSRVSGTSQSPASRTRRSSTTVESVTPARNKSPVVRHRSNSVVPASFRAPIVPAASSATPKASSIKTRAEEEDSNLYVSRSDYVEVAIKIAKCLHKPFIESEARQAAEEDYAHDARGGLITKQKYFDSLFELTDVWTTRATMRAYAVFLHKLYQRITKPSDKDGSTRQRLLDRVWRPLSECQGFDEGEMKTILEGGFDEEDAIEEARVKRLLEEEATAETDAEPTASEVLDTEDNSVDNAAPTVAAQEQQPEEESVASVQATQSFETAASDHIEDAPSTTPPAPPSVGPSIESAEPSKTVFSAQSSGLDEETMELETELPTDNVSPRGAVSDQQEEATATSEVQQPRSVSAVVHRRPATAKMKRVASPAPVKKKHVSMPSSPSPIASSALSAVSSKVQELMEDIPLNTSAVKEPVLGHTVLGYEPPSPRQDVEAERKELREQAALGSPLMRNPTRKLVLPNMGLSDEEMNRLTEKLTPAHATSAVPSISSFAGAPQSVAAYLSGRSNENEAQQHVDDKIMGRLRSQKVNYFALDELELYAENSHNSTKRSRPSTGWSDQLQRLEDGAQMMTLKGSEFKPKVTQRSSSAHRGVATEWATRRVEQYKERQAYLAAIHKERQAEQWKKLSDAKAMGPLARGKSKKSRRKRHTRRKVSREERPVSAMTVTMSRLGSQSAAARSAKSTSQLPDRRSLPKPSEPDAEVVSQSHPDLPPRAQSAVPTTFPTPQTIRLMVQEKLNRVRTAFGGNGPSSQHRIQLRPSRVTELPLGVALPPSATASTAKAEKTKRRPHTSTFARPYGLQSPFQDPLSPFAGGGGWRGMGAFKEAIENVIAEEQQQIRLRAHKAMKATGFASSLPTHDQTGEIQRLLETQEREARAYLHHTRNHSIDQQEILPLTPTGSGAMTNPPESTQSNTTPVRVSLRSKMGRQTASSPAAAQYRRKLSKDLPSHMLPAPVTTQGNTAQRQQQTKPTRRSSQRASHGKSHREVIPVLTIPAGRPPHVRDGAEREDAVGNEAGDSDLNGGLNGNSDHHAEDSGNHTASHPERPGADDDDDHERLERSLSMHLMHVENTAEPTQMSQAQIDLPLDEDASAQTAPTRGAFMPHTKTLRSPVHKRKRRTLQSAETERLMISPQVRTDWSAVNQRRSVTLAARPRTPLGHASLDSAVISTAPGQRSVIEESVEDRRMGTSVMTPTPKRVVSASVASRAHATDSGSRSSGDQLGRTPTRVRDREQQITPVERMIRAQEVSRHAGPSARKQWEAGLVAEEQSHPPQRSSTDAAFQYHLDNYQDPVDVSFEYVAMSESSPGVSPLYGQYDREDRDSLQDMSFGNEQQDLEYLRLSEYAFMQRKHRILQEMAFTDKELRNRDKSLLYKQLGTGPVARQGGKWIQMPTAQAVAPEPATAATQLPLTESNKRDVDVDHHLTQIFHPLARSLTRAMTDANAGLKRDVEREQRGEDAKASIARDEVSDKAAVDAVDTVEPTEEELRVEQELRTALTKPRERPPLNILDMSVHVPTSKDEDRGFVFANFTNMT